MKFTSCKVNIDSEKINLEPEYTTGTYSASTVITVDSFSGIQCFTIRY